MRLSKKMMALLALPLFSAAFAAEECKDGVCPVPAPAPGAAKVQAAPKTLEQAFAFLPDTLLEMDGKKFTKADFIAEFKADLIAEFPGMIPEQYIGQIPQEQLKQFATAAVEFQILKNLAAKDGYTADSGKFLEGLKKQVKEMSPEQRKEFDARLKLSGQTEEAYLKENANNKQDQFRFAISEWMKNKIIPTIKVSDEEVLKFYNENKQQFAQPETITVSHILIRAEKPGDADSEKKAEDKAKAVLAQIKQGADFGTLAETESACPSGKATKGSLGKIQKKELDQDFWKAAFALEKGGISDVVKTRFGYHIIKLQDKTAAVTPTFEDMKEWLTAYMTQMKALQAMQKAVADAKASGVAKVTKF